MSLSKDRETKELTKYHERQLRVDMAHALRDKGYSNVQIAKDMGLNESSVRMLLASSPKDSK